MKRNGGKLRDKREQGKRELKEMRRNGEEQEKSGWDDMLSVKKTDKEKED